MEKNFEVLGLNEGKAVDPGSHLLCASVQSLYTVYTVCTQYTACRQCTQPVDSVHSLYTLYTACTQCTQPVYLKVIQQDGSSKNISDTEGSRIEPRQCRRLLSVYRRVSPYLQANAGLLPETVLAQSVIKQ